MIVQPYWIDAHCHLAAPGISANLTPEISGAAEQGVELFMSSALSEEEYQWHLDLPHKYPDLSGSIFFCAGIHPYYSASSDKNFDLLSELANTGKIVAVGEIGLDGRADNEDWQIKILRLQLELARSYEMPVVFHVVQRYYQLYKILKDDFPKVRGYLHGFNGSRDIAEKFSIFELAFSLNARLPAPDTLQFIFQRGFFLLETDAPYVRPPVEKSECNHLSNLTWTASHLSQLCSIEKNLLKQLQHSNFKLLFPDIEKSNEYR